jgi:hypothetical protein
MSSSRLRNGDMAFPRPTENDCSRPSYRLKERAWHWRSAGRSSALMVDLWFIRTQVDSGTVFHFTLPKT